MPETLREKLSRVGGPLAMLRHGPANPFRFDYPAVYTNWQDEQAGWTRTAVLFDQSHHMTDVYFTGPDVDTLLEETGTNSFRTWGPGRAKHFVACTDEGKMVGSAVLFGLDREHVNLVGPTATANWVSHHAISRGHDVEIRRDERTADQPAGGRRCTFRFEIEGPAARAILEKAHGGPIEQVAFFAMTEFTLGGLPVRALSHTMAGVPGSESMGMEIWGPVQNRQACWDALVTAGEEFGLVRGGALAYYTGGIESGYAAQPTPAIYTAPGLREYREWLPGDGYEGKLSIGGSFAAPRIEDYYVSPYDFGYGHLVRFDHDFVGRAALEEAAGQPHRRKVWLRWNDQDVARIHAASLFGGTDRPKFLDTPLGRYSRVQLDTVLLGDRQVGLSTLCGYTVNVRSWMSVGFVDSDVAVDGAEVTVVWGEENGGTPKRNVEPHTQTTLRAQVHTGPLGH